MSFLGKILAPVEFSDRCAAAVRYAAMWARRFESQLILLHAQAGEPPEISEESCQARIRKAREQLDGLLAGEDGGLKVHRVLVKGDPARKIVQYAKDERVDGIWMATHGFGPFRRFLLGSNTAKVLHDADCPVCTGVHLEESSAGFFPVRRILCALDLGPQSEATLGWAAELQRQFGARLAIVHSTPLVPVLAKGPESNWNVIVREAAERELEKLRQSSGVKADLMLEAGDPAQVISAAAQRFAADVLVIGRGSAAGVFGRLRTNAYALIRQSPCPVVSV